VKPSRGFTLIEVLVALAIMALAFAALLRASGLAAENSATLRERMLAGWMAENHMARLQALHVWPVLGIQSGSLTQDQRSWMWEQEVFPTDDPQLLRIEIRILSPGAARYQLAHLVGFVARQARP
jgi:general secretion pathway protein I